MLIAIQLVPYTGPQFLHVKSYMLGATLTYAAVAFDDEAWGTVLAGVRSGRREWLVVAADLRSALDTHPGEEMHDAVSVAIDSNPADAVSILVPAYGTDEVCGSAEFGVPVSHELAQLRLDRLSGVPRTIHLDDCEKSLRARLLGRAG